MPAQNTFLSRPKRMALGGGGGGGGGGQEGERAAGRPERKV